MQEAQKPAASDAPKEAPKASPPLASEPLNPKPYKP